ncbi:uncharacterized protein si:ch211-51h9.7 isoform X2 [Stegostoma tigrinum]|uniref:uncharacterized protein si:ch211-51h9.7 isoform X2 n=1 Tax=Stegostoma tigrinum TaxID=3053191 RepID=UPI00202AF99F|nr:uncharacterized protein si:ch211-51h9.7 isoform X2 [Stegostoma tigrinum]
MWRILGTLLLVWLPAVSGYNAGQEEASSRDELLLCRSCGFEVAASRDLKFVASALALAQRNDTVIGERRVPVQLFQNPQGLRFQVGHFSPASGLSILQMKSLRNQRRHLLH